MTTCDRLSLCFFRVPDVLLQAECMARILLFVHEFLPPGLDDGQLEKLLALAARYGPE